jgi:hypothetical protein
VRYLEYIVRYGGVPGGSQHAAYRVTHNKFKELKRIFCAAEGGAN